MDHERVGFSSLGEMKGCGGLGGKTLRTPSPCKMGGGGKTKREDNI